MFCVNAAPSLVEPKVPKLIVHVQQIEKGPGGGKTNTENGQALCPACNLKRDRNETKTPNWQQDALSKAIDWLLVKRQDRHFPY